MILISSRHVIVARDHEPVESAGDGAGGRHPCAHGFRSRARAACESGVGNGVGDGAFERRALRCRFAFARSEN